MKRNHLKKAILLGLIAASIHAPVWAEPEPETIGGLWGSNINKTQESGKDLTIKADGVGIGFAGTVTVTPDEKGTGGDLMVTAGGNGILAGYQEKATVNISANNVTIDSDDNGIFTTWGDNIWDENGITEDAKLAAKENNTPIYVNKNATHWGVVNIGTQDNAVDKLNIYADGQGIDNKKGEINVYGSSISISSTGSGGINDNQAGIASGYIYTSDDGITVKTNGDTAVHGNTISITAEGGDGIATLVKDSNTVIQATNSITITSNNLNNTIDSSGNIIVDGLKTIENAGINNMAGATTVTTGTGLSITSSQYGILAQSGTVDVTSTTGNNIIQAAAKDAAAIDAMSIDVEAPEGSEGTDDPQEPRQYGTKHAIKAEGGAQVQVSALNGNNELYGVIYAKNADTAITVDHNAVDSNGNPIQGSGSNYIYSAAHGSTDDVGDRQKVVAALYAQDKGQITITAGTDGINYIETYYPELEAAEETQDETEDPGSERTIWAQRGGQIDITGTTIIRSSNAENFYENGYATNSRGIAITAGTGIDLKDPEHGYTGQDGNQHAFYENNTLADVDTVLGYRSSVDLKYGAGSEIYGDIVSGYGGKIDIATLTTNAEYGLHIQGNILAGNGGILDVDLGQGGVWYGRADDYGDAGYGEEAAGKLYFYSPVFSDDIYTGGEVNITMGAGSRWYLTGQSWVTSLDVSGGNGDVTIDMAQFNKGTHGLTISELKGTSDADKKTDATFIMDLDHTKHDTSDMLYIKNGTGEYDVVLNTMIDGIEDINENNVLRFATVQGGASFNSVTMKNTGLYDLGFEIGHSAYDTSKTEENESYNGESVSEDKPGNENVEGFFELDAGSETGAQTAMLLEGQTGTGDTANDVQNWYITRVSGLDLSDGGKTVVNMSRVNYSNAVYMDRLNKRLGEARYINEEEDQGMWVRVRHDRIGKDDAFRLMNTMYELGYDKKQESDSGERRFGAAIDYMDGSSSYTSVSGSGDISRKGIWLYDTWLGHKGHYRDFVAKWGHLSNDFTLYRGGDKITGDYCNNVYSLSAEYGRKKDLGHDWYFEPQAQLQYARVTGADYTTSQGTRVDLDAIDSLIARAGFRLGRDLDERSTVYFKADLLHEFLGDQNIYAADGTGTMNVTYDNEGTWFDVGLGFSKALSETSYVYLDVETSLGNDFEDTYQINAGLQWSFS